jgi:hypothetical protein
MTSDRRGDSSAFAQLGVRPGDWIILLWELEAAPAEDLGVHLPPT